MSSAKVIDTLLQDPDGLEKLAHALVDIRIPTVYTTETLAAELGVAPRTVRRAIESGELLATRRCGKWVMIADDVRAWVKDGERSRKASSAPPPKRREPSAPSRGAAAMLAMSEPS